MLRPADPADTPALIALGDATGVFQPGEAEALLGGVLGKLHAGNLGDGHSAQVWAETPDGPPLGWVYFAPTPHADGVWDLWWIGVDPASQGQGIGGELLRFVESHVREAGGRLLIIETSSQPALDPTRRYYANRGYAERGRVPDFYADGDDKVIFARRVAAKDDAEGLSETPDDSTSFRPLPNAPFHSFDPTFKALARPPSARHAPWP